MKTLTYWLVLLSAIAPVQYAGAWGRFPGGEHPDHGGRWARPNPVVVHRQYVDRRPGGCVGCGGGAAAVAGLVGGLIVGAAIASNSQPNVVVEQEPLPPAVVVQQGPPPGTEISVLPPGCTNMNINGATYYQCGPVWYQPFFGGNGVYYAVVPTP